MSLLCSSPRQDLESQVSYDVSEYGGPHHQLPRSPRSPRIPSKALYLTEDEIEVDYDEGASELYKRIEGKDWDGALARLDRAPSEAKTWVSRHEYNSEELRWRLLPVHATCIFRSPLALIEALIKTYPDGPQMKDDQGMLPVHLACRNGASKGVVLTLLNAFPNSISVKDRKGRTPIELVQSSASQNKEAVMSAMRRFQLEFERGPTLNRTGSHLSKSASTVIGNGPNEVDYEHRTVLFRLVLKKDWNGAAARARTFPDEASTWIVTKGFNGNLRFLPLHKACVLNPPVTLIETLVAANVDGANSRDQDGWLPIHCACFYGASDEIVTALLVANPKGAQVKCDEGRLPLHYACLKAAPKGVIDALLKAFPKGASSKDDDGRLPVHHACSKGATDGVIDALLKASPKGAQYKDDSGRLALHHACRKNASEHVVRLLVRVYPRAAQIKDDQEKLPVHYACQNGATTAVVQLLLTTYPESISVKNGLGYTPLAEARAMDNPKMKPIILELEKFKKTQDKIKVENGDSAELEAKLSVMTQRVLALEQALHSVASLGKDLKHNMKKTDDTHALLGKFAEKLASMDSGIASSSLGVAKGDPGTPTKRRGLPSPLRGLGRKSSNSPSGQQPY